MNRPIDSSHGNLPKSFEDAKAKVMEMLSEQEKKQIIAIPRETLTSRCHATFGAEIRNKLGLWRPEAEQLLCSIAAANPEYSGVMPESDGTYYVNPDGASAILILAVWDTLSGNSLLKELKGPGSI